MSVRSLGSLGFLGSLKVGVFVRVSTYVPGAPGFPGWRVLVLVSDGVPRVSGSPG